MRPICSATQMIKAFFLRHLISNTKHVNHVFSCFASRTQNLSSLYKFEAYISCNRLYIYTTHIYFITRVFFNYCCWQFPPHLQRPFHTRLAFIHSQLQQLSFACLRGSLPKSGPLDFATKNTFPLFFVGEEALVGIY